MLESIGRFRWRSVPFSAWLFRIAHNLAIDHFRSRRRWQPEEDVPEPPGSREEEPRRSAIVDRRRPARADRRLSPEQRQVLTLKFVFRFSNGEVAAILDKTEGAVISPAPGARLPAQARNALEPPHGARRRDRRPPGSGKTTLFPRSPASGRRAMGHRTSGSRRSRTSGCRKSQTWSAPAAQTPATIRLIACRARPPRSSAACAGPTRCSPSSAIPTTSRRSSWSCSSPTGTVERRLERVRRTRSRGDPTLRAEVELLERLIAHIDDERALRDWPGELPLELEPLTTKPLIPIVNGPDGVDLALEADPRSPCRGGGAVSKRRLVGAGGRRAPARLRPRSRGLLHSRRQRGSRLDAKEQEDRAGTAASIHTDMARGFIRCEVIRWDDLVSSGSYAEAARRGYNGSRKGYVVADGDVLNIRFNV